MVSSSLERSDFTLGQRTIFQFAVAFGFKTQSQQYVSLLFSFIQISGIPGRSIGCAGGPQ